jgi:hypothetical protein
MPTAIPGTLGGPIPGFDSVTGSYLAAGLLVAVAVVASRTLARRTGLPLSGLPGGGRRRRRFPSRDG